jgi:hypothetical protein
MKRFIIEFSDKAYQRLIKEHKILDEYYVKSVIEDIIICSGAFGWDKPYNITIKEEKKKK